MNVQIIGEKNSVGVMEVNNVRKNEGVYHLCYQNTMCYMS